ncbi:hypothetical protein M427DRAFT_69096 [Gonapodya prolifera JEL478]|uniref:P-type ATPase A domain-containing protein n=1 Tax=Gonapodya prolifera (strain JEL478) TaxID=1344416 RepID=A0A139AI90_GONPJ|nr:hypothetical protein M427DRAFT_69096 [Gonapodya prolifera JEL478]|eukprot:KXS16536.1 hypothetical protein M427DRAFT_69096 [Gonapodya prolifera JEL478]
MPSECTVLRDGGLARVPATELVCGDIVSLSSGNKVPADLRLIEASADARFHRSILTGESEEVDGRVDMMDPDFLESKNIALMGHICTLSLIPQRKKEVNVLRKSLATVETLGCVNVTAFGFADGAAHSVPSVGFNRTIVPVNEALNALFKAAPLCNEATFDRNQPGQGSALQPPPAFSIPFNSRNKWMLRMFRSDFAAASTSELLVAGMRFFMVTGDFGLTAAAIGHSVDEDGFIPASLVLEGKHICNLTDAQLDVVCRHKETVFARTTPEQKLTIVNQLKSRDYVVAVMGDGVNDAPTLKAAHVGIAISTGSDVAIEAETLVLIGTFDSITTAVRLGRLSYLFIGTMMTVISHGMFFLYYWRYAGIPMSALFFAFENYQDGFFGYTSDELIYFNTQGQSVSFVVLVILQLGNLLSRTAKGAVAGKKGAKKAVAHKYVLDASDPVKDGIFDTASFEKFLQDRIKVAGRTSNLGEAVTISKPDGNSIAVTVDAKVPFAKRYLKYLTKKFLKKQQLRDYVRVISTSKTTYQLKYFNISPEDEADE